MGEIRYYDRETLYKELWKEPTTKVAKRYGVSDVALAKTCKKLNVPKPPVGYWTKVECGKNPKKSKLPKFENPPKLMIHEPRKILKEEPKDVLVPEAFEESDRLIQREDSEEYKITVPTECKKWHPFVSATRRYYRELKKNHYYRDHGKISFHGENVFPISIGPQSLDRVSLILQSMCESFKLRGFKLENVESHDRRFQYARVIVQGEPIDFRIMESSTRVEVDEGKYSYKSYEYEPNGILVLELTNPPWGMGSPKKWRDGKRGKLEDKLNQVMIGFLTASAWEKEGKKRHELREIERKKEQEIQREKDRLRRIEERKIKFLGEMTDRWSRYQQVESFVSEFRSRIDSVEDSGSVDEDIKDWLGWAERYLKSSNPLDLESFELPKFEGWYW